jgi:hypothetical protein
MLVNSRRRARKEIDFEASENNSTRFSYKRCADPLFENRNVRVWGSENVQNDYSVVTLKRGGTAGNVSPQLEMDIGSVKIVTRQRSERDEKTKEFRFAWLKNPRNPTVKQQGVIKNLNVPKLNLKTAKGYQIKLTFQELYQQPGEQAEKFLKRWYFWTTHSRLQPMIEAARTIKRHWDGVLRWFESRITNGVLEGINSLIQAAKAKARGYRSTKNLITIVYLIAGKLDLSVTHT